MNSKPLLTSNSQPELRPNISQVVVSAPTTIWDDGNLDGNRMNLVWQIRLKNLMIIGESGK